jgi:hypothetical protein
MNLALQKPKIAAEPAANCRPFIPVFAVFVFLVVALFATMAPHAAAQGCAMCYQNAASSGAQGRAALRHGILILLVPALALFVGILLLVYHHRSATRAS